MNQESVCQFLDAAGYNDVNVVIRLLDETPTIINTKNEKAGWTALHWASYNEHESIIELLLNRGANPNAQTNDGDTALNWASNYGNSAIALLLLDNGADVDVRDSAGWTALHWASFNEHESIIELLLNRGANPNAQTNDGDTALNWASNYGNSAIALLLLKSGADVDLRDSTGWTALHWASCHGHADIARMLLNAGADTNQRNKDGNTAADVATSDDILHLLRQHPAAGERPPTHSPPTAVFNTIASCDIEIVGRINLTAFSSVYRGVYRKTDVAIKMLRGDAAMCPFVHQETEIVIMSTLRHPRIVTLLGVVLNVQDCYEATVGLVTEYMPRGSLYDVLHLDTTPPEHRLHTLSSKMRVLIDVADGMQFLHLSNVIHGDLKSPNVLIDEEGRAKICDFGVSKLLPHTDTHSSTVIGTPAWSSPEVLLGTAGGVRKSADVYSFGVILWEILTGQIPWAGLSAVHVAIQLSYKQSLPISAAMNADTHPLQLDLLKSCLRSTPDARPTFECLRQCLSDVLNVCAKREELASRRVICPAEYICPISLDIMVDPVICSDGHTYEKEMIAKWLNGNGTSPLTNVLLEDKTLRPNISLRNMIDRFNEAHRLNGIC